MRPCKLAKDVDNRDEITDPQNSGIPPLVALLSGDSNTGAKKNAATALGRLALDWPTIQCAIAKAGAITALVKWLTIQWAVPGMSELAARSLADVASENAETAQQVVNAGAVPALVAMLENGRGNDAQKSSSGALATLTKASYLADSIRSHA